MNFNGYNSGNCGDQRQGGLGPRNSSSPNMQQGGTYGYIGQKPGQGQACVYGYQQPTISSSRSSVQRVGRNSRSGTQQMQPQPLMQTQLQRMQTQLCQQKQQHDQRRGMNMSSPAASSAYNTGCQPVMVNVSAATMANAGNTPVGDRGECSVGGNPGVKYIPLSWEDILGTAGTSGMKVSMMPSGDPNANRQLKISFGGNSCPQEQTGETPLKVVSFQPMSSGRVNRQQGPSPAQAIAREAVNFTVGDQLAARQGQGASLKKMCACANCQRK